MTLKKTLAVLLTGIFAFSPALAFAIDTWHLSINRDSTETNYNLDDPATGEMHILSFDIHTGYYQWLNPNLFKAYILGPDGMVSTTTEVADIADLQSQINGLSGGNMFNVSAFMANQASTTPLVATSTFNGFMSGSMVTKLAALSTSTPTFATSTRSLTTSTGATGFQISSSRPAMGVYSIKVVTTATIGSPSEGYVEAEIALTNSATASDWIPVGTCGNGQNVTLAALLSSSQTTYCTLNVPVPIGYYIKLRSITVSDTPTFTLLSTWEKTE